MFTWKYEKSHSNIGPQYFFLIEIKILAGYRAFKSKDHILYPFLLLR